MKFVRNNAHSWKNEIPGARWFKTDLHVHTIDDHPGKRVKLSNYGLNSSFSSRNLRHYARKFLQVLVTHKIQVVGLTPHSPRIGNGSATSAVWRIVKEWNEGKDDDGVPFREKIYAIFPGFEPSFPEGKQGLHLLILFDPEIGITNYLKAFDLVMCGVSPWKEAKLKTSSHTSEKALAILQKFLTREVARDDEVEHLVLAPHIESENGLLGAKKGQVLSLFKHQHIAALELNDGKTPIDALKNRPWLKKGMDNYRQAFFHASDSYNWQDIGLRYTWIKLASPRIAALRQAFLANDSRLRIGFERSENGNLQEITNPPDVMQNKHPWLREITISGAASFFGGQDKTKDYPTQFRLSPDLTCIIGGSMAGKSTFLDGLRTYSGAQLPRDEIVRKDVEARGQNFAAGNADIDWTCPESDSTLRFRDQWPAKFYTQNELLHLSREPRAIEDILVKLVPSEMDEIEKCHKELRNLDEQISKLVGKLENLDEKLDVTDLACQRSRDAKKALKTFAEAGVEHLQLVSHKRLAWKDVHSNASNLRNSLLDLLADASSTQEIPDIDEKILTIEGITICSLGKRWQKILDGIQTILHTSEEWIDDVLGVVEALEKQENNQQGKVYRALAIQGFDRSSLMEFETLSRQASLLTSYESANIDIRQKRTNSEDEFVNLRRKRSSITDQTREAFDRVISNIECTFGNQIRVNRVNEGDVTSLDQFLRELRQIGITRWWNGLENNRKLSSEKLIAHFDNESLDEIGMSDAIQKTFRESLTRTKRRELEALRCPDVYRLELQMVDGSYRPLKSLSGGQKITVLLSLLLETHDNRPLVIDQPEDALDNRILLETVLPALKKLRGRRQVIVATHNANIVVNGDADLVVLLEADAYHGEIACSGTIEQPEVRDAIIRTVDGGKEAFHLRRCKYGF